MIMDTDRVVRDFRPASYESAGPGAYGMLQFRASDFSSAQVFCVPA
jgi:hypothetical protein